MKEFEVNDIELKLLELKSEHRDLDSIIHEMVDSVHPDQLRIARLKRRKLRLKDNILKLESMQIPDLDA